MDIIQFKVRSKNQIQGKKYPGTEKEKLKIINQFPAKYVIIKNAA